LVYYPGTERPSPGNLSFCSLVHSTCDRIPLADLID
jgi:hypothetical protein